MKKPIPTQFFSKYRNLHETNDSQDFQNALTETLDPDGELGELFTAAHELMQLRKNALKFTGKTSSNVALLRKLSKMRKTIQSLQFKIRWINQCTKANSFKV